MPQDPVYLDCAATTPVDPRVAEAVAHHLTAEFGNSGSRTHEFGSRARKAVDAAREQVASVAELEAPGVVFCSGATEANNLALLGLAQWGETQGRMHVVSTALEHKAVLEPLEYLAKRGFDVDLVPSTSAGRVAPDEVLGRVRPDTLVVSMMQVNNETGVRQPVEGVADGLADHPAYLHMDAAQGFGKDLAPGRHPRVDLASASGHKLYAPMGIGALLYRRRGRERPPLAPLMYGGDQERGYRSGTVPVPLVVGFGLACELALQEHDERAAACSAFRTELLEALQPLDPVLHGDQDHVIPHILNLSFPGLDSEAVMLMLRDLVAISNGSACTTERVEPSHVLSAMGLPEEPLSGAVRFSWSHETPRLNWDIIRDRLASLR